MATQCFMPSSANPSNRTGSHSQLPHVVSTITTTIITTTTTTSTTTPASSTSGADQSLSSQQQICVDSVNQANNRPQEIAVSGDAPLSLTKVILPAQVVVAHPLTEQQVQQQSVLFQALTSQSTQHFIALVPPGQETETLELQSAQSVSCLQYIDEGGGPNIFTAPNGHMTTYSVYNSQEPSTMYTPHSAAYYNNTTSNSENYTTVVNESPAPANGPVENNNYSEPVDAFSGIDENSSNDHESSTVSCYPSSRLSVETIRWLMENYELAEGLSVPRSTMYNHYLKHCDECKMEPLNAASFGKLIRSVFTGLRTRRLGTRGNSKYHYYGIRLKPCSVIDKNTENMISSTLRPNPFAHVRRMRQDNSVKLEGAEDKSFNNGNNSERDLNRSEGSPQEKHQIYLGDASTALPTVEIEINSCSLPDGITMEDVDHFRNLYREHCETFLDSVVNFQFGVVESLWHTFWRKNVNEPEDEHVLNKSVLYKLCTWKPIQEFIKHTDYQFYQNLVDVLIPDVLRPIPSTLTQAIRTFAKGLEGWLKSAMSDCSGDIVNIKVSAISAFAQTLRRYTSLNHLAQAARAVLQSSTQIKQMTADLNRVDFRSVQEQASWVCQCEDETVQKLLGEFRQTLQHHLWLEEWAVWLENIVHTTLQPYEGKPTYPKAARHFLLKWSFYSSLVIRDLTLRSAASFGSFHLLRLLYDEYMFFIIEHAIARATGTTSIAVMGEYLCSGKPEELCGEGDISRWKRMNGIAASNSQEQDLINGCIDAEVDSSHQNGKRKRE